MSRVASIDVEWKYMRVPIRDWSCLINARVRRVRGVGPDQIERLAGGEIVDVSTRLGWVFSALAF